MWEGLQLLSWTYYSSMWELPQPPCENHHSFYVRSITASKQNVLQLYVSIIIAYMGVVSRHLCENYCSICIRIITAYMWELLQHLYANYHSICMRNITASVSELSQHLCKNYYNIYVIINTAYMQELLQLYTSSELELLSMLPPWPRNKSQLDYEVSNYQGWISD